MCDIIALLLLSFHENISQYLNFLLLKLMTSFLHFTHQNTYNFIAVLAFLSKGLDNNQCTASFERNKICNKRTIYKDYSSLKGKI